MSELQLTAPPILSTSETHIFEDPTPAPTTFPRARLTDAELWDVYEIARTTRKLREGGWRRVALQFPDGMLGDAVRVFEALETELKGVPPLALRQHEEELEPAIRARKTSTQETKTEGGKDVDGERRVRLYILADTSYGSCCVDEIAAEHVDADVVIHYGRSCLSPTARLPVIYVFTSHFLDIDAVVQAFESTFPRREEKVVLMADITYHNHIESIHDALVGKGFTGVVKTEIVHDPSSQIPNRRLSGEEGELGGYKLFHISDPPPALLLTLSSRVKEMFIYPTTSSPPLSSPSPPTPTKPTHKAIQANTTRALQRRYALLTRLSTVPIFGILINTLSVSHYLTTVSSLQRMISLAGKKSYTFVVGKVNAAKIANFSEIDGWVVVGCWESSLIESTEFYRPIITPFELGLCLQGDEKRVWDGSWRGDFRGVEGLLPSVGKRGGDERDGERRETESEREDEEDHEESAPPEFDLRTGRYVSHSRPMRTSSTVHSDAPQDANGQGESAASKALTRRAKGDMVMVNGTASPGAEYLRNQRTWQGLGSDFAETEAPDGIEEGRSGVARGYTVGENGERH